ncbi:hypothetical protein JTB14_017300 [Gonioctena quinquepunctata]|nr:hypothetical protein JTB14_017300 [Gonioctena quinquepunctata]
MKNLSQKTLTHASKFSKIENSNRGNLALLIAYLRSNFSKDNLKQVEQGLHKVIGDFLDRVESRGCDILDIYCDSRFNSIKQIK